MNNMNNRNQKLNRQAGAVNERQNRSRLVNQPETDKITPDIKQRLDDALRRLNTAAEDIREIRRFLQAA